MPPPRRSASMPAARICTLVALRLPAPAHCSRHTGFQNTIRVFRTDRPGRISTDIKTFGTWCARWVVGHVFTARREAQRAEGHHRVLCLCAPGTDVRVRLLLQERGVCVCGVRLCRAERGRLYDERGGAAQAVMSTPTGVTHLKFMADPYVPHVLPCTCPVPHVSSSNYLLCGGRQSNELLVCLVVFRSTAHPQAVLRRALAGRCVRIRTPGSHQPADVF